MEREPAHGTRSPGASERCSTNSVEMLVRIPRAAPRPIAILAALMVREAVFFSFRAKVCCAKHTRVRAYHGVRQDVDAKRRSGQLRLPPIAGAMQAHLEMGTISPISL